MNKYPHFTAALRQLGEDRQPGAHAAAVAKALGVSERAAFLYLSGALLPKADKIVKFPTLISALQQDVGAPHSACAILQVPA